MLAELLEHPAQDAPDTARHIHVPTCQNGLIQPTPVSTMRSVATSSGFSRHPHPATCLATCTSQPGLHTSCSPDGGKRGLSGWLKCFLRTATQYCCRDRNLAFVNGSCVSPKYLGLQLNALSSLSPVRRLPGLTEYFSFLLR